MKRLLNMYKPLVIAISIYLFSLLILNPFSEYAVNDDWDFITHVRNFKHGDYVKNSLIDSSFILQGLAGVLWSNIFRLSYASLKTLTVIITLLTLLGLDKLLKLFNSSAFERFIGLVVFLFNPFVYPFSFTFMTEIYFLFFVVWSVYFQYKYLTTKEGRYIFWTLLLSSLSLLVRQFGLLLFPAHFVSFLFIGLNNKYKIRYLAAGAGIFIVCGLISFLWPQYNSDMERPLDIIFKPVLNPSIVVSSLLNLPYLITYFAFSVLVFTLPLFFKISLKARVGVLTGTFLLFKTFLSVDIFKYGNVLYSEGLQISNNYQQHVNLYDNSFFKSVLIMLLLVSIFSFLAYIAGHYKDLKKQRYLPLALLLLFLTVPACLGENFFDRYLVNGIIIFGILCQTFIVDSAQISRKYVTISLVILSFWVIYIFTLSYDFHKSTQIQWREAAVLKSNRPLDTGIFLSDTYSKYNSVYFKDNGPQIVRAMPLGITYYCYIQKDYQIDGANPFYIILSKAGSGSKFGGFFKNPEVFESKTSAGYRPPTRDPKKILSRREYFSLQEWLVGTKVSVITYCNDKE